MTNFILSYYSTSLILALTLTVLAIFLIKKTRHIGLNIALLGGVAIAWTTVGLKIKNQQFYLESPSQNQPAYILKFKSGKDVAFFASRYFKLFESYNGNKSKLTMQLLNPKICLLVSWSLPAAEAERVKSEHFGTKIIFPAKNEQNLCPGLQRIELKFAETSFNHIYETLSPTSARNLYYFEHLE